MVDADIEGAGRCFVTFSLDESFRASRDATNALIASCSRGDQPEEEYKPTNERAE